MKEEIRQQIAKDLHIAYVNHCISHGFSREDAEESYKRMAESVGEPPRAEPPLRCCVTGNPCGSDTWAKGRPCPCFNCTLWLQKQAGSRPSAPAPSDDRVEFSPGGPCSASGDGDTEQKYHKHVAPATSGEPPTDREAAELVCERLNGFSDEPIIGKIFPVLVEMAKELIAARRDLACERGVLTMTVARLGGMVEGNPTARHNFLQRIDELTSTESDLKRMLGEALGNVKTMQYTLQEIYEYCKDYADAPTLTKQTALGVVRGTQEKAWRELQGKTVIPESSPVDLKDAARKWLEDHESEFWTRHYDPKYGEFDIPAALAAFAAAVREGR